MGKKQTSERYDGVAIVHYWEQAHDGRGFYYIDSEYPEDGSCGAFRTLGSCMAHAVGGYDNIELCASALKRHREMEHKAAARRKRAKGKPRAGGAK